MIDEIFHESVIKRISAIHPKYRTWRRKKASGWREITSPVRELKLWQRDFARYLAEHGNVHDAAHGFVRGRSTVTHASLHTGADLVITMDIRDFFPSISGGEVYGVLSDVVPPGVDAVMLAALVLTADASIPQGAPTSPMIANLVMRELDDRLTNLARSGDGVYSRYADDLAFSFRGSIGFHACHVVHAVDHLLQACTKRLHIAPEKTKVMPANGRQIVTGLVVNGDGPPRVPREMVRRLRAAAHQGEDVSGLASYVDMVTPGRGSRAAGIDLDETK